MEYNAVVVVVFCAFDLEIYHNGVPFFDISTSKTCMRPSVFYTIDFDICFAPQRRAIFFISHLAKWLRTCRFSEPTFRPSGATHHCKNTVFGDLPTFSHLSHTWTFLLLTFSFLIFFLLLFSSLTLPISAFFLSISYCRKFDF